MRITLPSGTPAELALPEGGEPVRGLALAPDIMGLRPLFDDLCARLASEHRWAVCAPEPFPGQEDLPLEQRLSQPFDDARALRDLTEAADATGCERVAVLGFCMGGWLALKAAGTGRFDRAVAFYGMIRTPEPWRSATTVEPLDALASGRACPVLAIIGGRDQWTPPADVDALRALPNVEVVVYPDAEHGFVHDASRPAHRADDAADAWRRALAFLA
jgi:carboxymethylenebutenolidase